MTAPLTIEHWSTPYKGDCVWGVLRSHLLGFVAQDVNLLPDADQEHVAAHSGKLGKGQLDAPWTGLPSGTKIENIHTAQWRALGGPPNGGPQRPATADDIIAAVVGLGFTPCFDLKRGKYTHQTKPYLTLKASADAHGVPVIVMTEQWSKVCKTRKAKDEWEAAAKLIFLAAGKAGLPRMLLWREHIPADSDWWDLVESVKGAPATQIAVMPSRVVAVPEHATAATARAVLDKVLAKAEWGTPTPNPEVPPVTSYPGADAATQWFYDNFGGSPMHPNVVVLHTTEGGDWPGYAGGSMAPNLTVKADKQAKKFRVRQHFPLDRSSRALRNAAGGVETNTLNCIQIELIGTCDPAHKDGYGAIYWPDAPEWCYVELGKLLAELHRMYPAIRLVAGGDVVNGHWPAYPASINANRMSGAQWSKFTGICGHQHVPENVHGDPGALPIAKILTYAKGGNPVPAPTPKPVTRGPRVDAAIAAAHTEVAQLKLVKRPSVADKVKQAQALAQQSLDLLNTIPPL